MASLDQVVARWVAVTMGRSTKPQIGGTNIIGGDKDHIYSYGHHFEMARTLRTKKGEPYAFLLNGDTYSVSTSRHQSEVRGAVGKTGLPSVVIPYSALRAANIDLSTVEILEDTEPGWERTDHRGPVAPKDMFRAYDLVWHEETQEFTWYTNRHWLGESLISAKVTWQGRTPCKWCWGSGRAPGPVQAEWRSGRERRVYNEACQKYEWVLPEPTWHEERPPYCGECGGAGYRGWTKTRRAKFLSGFDHGEARRSYFFCELPKTDATTVAEAYVALKPDAVRLAEQMGRTVYRQGDIFAVELASVTLRHLRKQGATVVKHGNLLGTNHEATEVAYLPDGTTLVRGVLRHNPQGRRPDHARVKVGNRWSVVVKNTVPLAA